MGWSTRSRKPHYQSSYTIHIIDISRWTKTHKIYHTRLYIIHIIQYGEYLLDPPWLRSNGDEQVLLDPPLLYLCRPLRDTLDLVAPTLASAGGDGGGGLQRADSACGRRRRRADAGVWPRRAAYGRLHGRAAHGRWHGRRRALMAWWRPRRRRAPEAWKPALATGVGQGPAAPGAERKGPGQGPAAPGVERKGPGSVG
uniref:Uncharacterized protein n=1 Tax=Triticum urartu TaxID=4572 RepID=A0A8R7Q4N5_TRIUA